MELSERTKNKIYNAVVSFLDTQPSNFVLLPESTDSITARISTKTPGIFSVTVNEDSNRREIICKIKSNAIIKNSLQVIGTEKTLGLVIDMALNHGIFDYKDSYIRENYIYQQKPASLAKYLPNVLYMSGDSKESIILMEKFTKSDWLDDKKLVKKLISALATFQASYYNDATCVKNLHLNHYSSQNYKNSRHMLTTIFTKFNNQEFFSKAQILELLSFIDSIHALYEKLPEHNSLTHNDFTPRNICYDVNEKRFIIYDWELACFQNPEHDLIEFLVATSGQMSDKEILNLIHYYYQEFEKNTKLKLSNQQKQEILSFNLHEYIVVRLSLLRLFSRHYHFSFMDTMTKKFCTLNGVTGEIQWMIIF